VKPVPSEVATESQKGDIREGADTRTPSTGEFLEYTSKEAFPQAREAGPLLRHEQGRKVSPHPHTTGTENQHRGAPLEYTTSKEAIPQAREVGPLSWRQRLTNYWTTWLHD